MGAIDRAATQDDFVRAIGNVSPAFVGVLDPHRTTLTKDHFGCVGSREHREIRAPHSGLQKGRRSALSSSVALGYLIHPESELGVVVEVIVALESRGHRRVDEGLRQWVDGGKINHSKSSTNAVKVASSPLLVFEGHECWEEIVVPPNQRCRRRPIGHR